MTALSSARSDEPVRVYTAPVRLGPGATATGWLLRAAWKLLVVTALTPAALGGLVLVVFGVLLWSVSPLLMLTMAALGVGLLAGCRLVWPDRWLRWVRLPLRSWWRGWFIYRHRW